MLNKNKIAVISSGNGGQAMAAYLSYLGYTVSLYVREHDRVAMFPCDNVFKLRGIVEGDPAVALISSCMADVVRDAHLIMVTTPSQYHPVVAREMAEHLEDGQMVVLNPGRTFGAHVFVQTLEQNGNVKQVMVAEAETFVFACRCARVAEPVIYGIKENVWVAAHQSNATPQVLSALSKPFPGVFKAARSIYETSFSNIGMVFHPLPILLNITRVEAQEKFRFYRDGISPLVANILERLDNERIAVAKAFNTSVISAYDWLEIHYGSQGDTLYERIQNTEAYAKIYAPTDIDTRYIFEDMLTGCVPVNYAGQVAKVPTPVINSAILWASTLYETDFNMNGRNQNVLDFEALFAASQTP